MEVRIGKCGFASSIILSLFGLVWFFLRAWAAGGFTAVQELGEAIIEFLEKRSRDAAAVCPNYVESHMGSHNSLDGEVDVKASGIHLDSKDVHVVQEAEEMANWVASRMVIWVAERIVLCKKVALYPWGECRQANIGMYYAVAEGWHHGLYRSWRDCKEAVVQYPTARFMSFASREQAEKFVLGWGYNFVLRAGFKSIP